MEKKKKQKRAIHHVDPLEIKETIGEGEEKTRLLFSMRLNELLCEKETAQEDLAKKTELSMSSISTYRNGKAEPKITALNRIANYLNVSADYLLGNTEIKNPDPQMPAACEFTGLTEQAINILLTIQDPDFEVFPDYEPSHIAILNTLFEQGFMTELLISFGQFLYNVVARHGILEWYPNRSEAADDVMQPAIWHLNKEIANAIDDVINPFLGSLQSYYTGREKQE